MHTFKHDFKYLVKSIESDNEIYWWEKLIISIWIIWGSIGKPRGYTSSKMFTLSTDLIFSLYLPKFEQRPQHAETCKDPSRYSVTHSGSCKLTQYIGPYALSTPRDQLQSTYCNNRKYILRAEWLFNQPCEKVIVINFAGCVLSTCSLKKRYKMVC